MSPDPLSIDVYVAPMRPYTSPDPLGEGEVATWAPSSSTLISGSVEGILIDALLTFDNADRVGPMVKRSGKKITGVYITHGDGDHWLGPARLLEHFPHMNGVSTRKVDRLVQQMRLRGRRRIRSRGCAAGCRVLPPAYEGASQL